MLADERQPYTGGNFGFSDVQSFDEYFSSVVSSLVLSSSDACCMPCENYRKARDPPPLE
jgi:hypothetical protein